MSCSYEWDLNKLYTSLDSKEYKKDKEEVKSLIQKEISLAENFKKESIEEYLKCEERLSVLLTLMFSYSSLKTSIVKKGNIKGVVTGVNPGAGSVLSNIRQNWLFYF
jgi:oligoendopeptidase F